MSDAERHASSESRALASIEPAAPIEVKQVAVLRFSPVSLCPRHHTKRANRALLIRDLPAVNRPFAKRLFIRVTYR
jgi:hypothetical protein